MPSLLNAVQPWLLVIDCSKWSRGEAIETMGDGGHRETVASDTQRGDRNDVGRDEPAKDRACKGQVEAAARNGNAYTPPPPPP
jgi:hypothetical protein